MSEIKHGYADDDSVNIHYAEAGEGPLVVTTTMRSRLDARRN